MAFVPQRERGGAKTPPPHGEGEGAVCSLGLVSGLLLASTPPGALAAPCLPADAPAGPDRVWMRLPPAVTAGLCLPPAIPQHSLSQIKPQHAS